MVSLSSGAVPFLFTDIEGSTARWEHDRDQVCHPCPIRLLPHLLSLRNRGYEPAAVWPMPWARRMAAPRRRAGTRLRRAQQQKRDVGVPLWMRSIV
jgi:hypothetical protein